MALGGLIRELKISSSFSSFPLCPVEPSTVGWERRADESSAAAPELEAAAEAAAIVTKTRTIVPDGEAMME